MFTLVTGLMIILMAKEYSLDQLGKHTRGNGKTIKCMDMEYQKIQIMMFIQETGLIIFEMDRELFNGLMVTHM